MGAQAPEIAQRIESVSEALWEPRQLDAVSEPAKVIVEDVKSNLAEIEAGYWSVGPESRKLVMSTYLTELLLDPEERIVNGRLRYPLSSGYDNGEPDQEDLDSSARRDKVGQE